MRLSSQLSRKRLRGLVRGEAGRVEERVGSAASSRWSDVGEKVANAGRAPESGKLLTYVIREMWNLKLLQDVRVTTSSRFLEIYVWHLGGTAWSRFSSRMLEAVTLPCLTVAPVSELGPRRTGRGRALLRAWLRPGSLPHPGNFAMSASKAFVTSDRHSSF